jgi:predicted  nucleic acid-binding Zn-ribbon protein
MNSVTCQELSSVVSRLHSEVKDLNQKRSALEERLHTVESSREHHFQSAEAAAQRKIAA